MGLQRPYGGCEDVKDDCWGNCRQPRFLTGSNRCLESIKLYLKCKLPDVFPADFHYQPTFTFSKIAPLNIYIYIYIYIHISTLKMQKPEFPGVLAIPMAANALPPATMILIIINAFVFPTKRCFNCLCNFGFWKKNMQNANLSICKYILYSQG